MTVNPGSKPWRFRRRNRESGTGALPIRQQVTYKLAVLRSTWQSSVIQASIDVQEWDQLSVGSPTYRARKRQLVTDCLPSLVHAHWTI